MVYGSYLLQTTILVSSIGHWMSNLSVTCRTMQLPVPVQCNVLTVLVDDQLSVRAMKRCYLCRIIGKTTFSAPLLQCGSATWSLNSFRNPPAWQVFLLTG
jgi:hypothetical protein